MFSVGDRVEFVRGSFGARNTISTEAYIRTRGAKFDTCYVVIDVKRGKMEDTVVALEGLYNERSVFGTTRLRRVNGPW